MMKKTRNLLSWENGKNPQVRASLEDAQKQFKEMAADWTHVHAEKLVNMGAAEWRYDPECEETFGLVITGTNTALVVIYGPINDVIGRERWDFELSDGFLAGGQS